MLWWQEGNLTLLMSPLSSHLSFWTSVLQLSVAGSCILAVSTSVIHHSIVRCSLGVLKGIPRLFFLACCGQRLPFHMLFCLRPVYGRTSQGMRERRRCPPCWLQGYTCIYCLSLDVAVFDHCVHDDVTDNGWTLCLSLDSHRYWTRCVWKIPRPFIFLRFFCVVTERHTWHLQQQGHMVL